MQTDRRDRWIEAGIAALPASQGLSVGAHCGMPSDRSIDHGIGTPSSPTIPAVCVEGLGSAAFTPAFGTWTSCGGSPPVDRQLRRSGQVTVVSPESALAGAPRSPSEASVVTNRAYW